jgi:endonuclease-3 related protein
MSQKRATLLHDVYDRLFPAFGPQHWWPADTAFEVILGAILTQNTSWKNVKQCIEKLRSCGLLTFEAISSLPIQELAPLLRSSGYYNQKARKINAFCVHMNKHWEGDIQLFLAQEMQPLRSELLTIHGVGPETADSIVLYAAFKPSFVVDRYTHRIFSRHSWVAESMTYDELRDFFMDSLEPDVKLFQEYHALLVRTGHLYCRKEPLCKSCPLSDADR